LDFMAGISSSKDGIASSLFFFFLFFDWRIKHPLLI
jgi:hypothetical protein